MQQEILETLFLYYGYTAPLPLVLETTTSLSEADSKKLSRLLGISWNAYGDEISKHPISKLAKSYLDCIVANTRPLADSCDIDVRNQMPIASSSRFRCLRMVVAEDSKRTLYMLDFGTRSQTAWKLALSSATNALLVC